MTLRPIIVFTLLTAFAGVVRAAVPPTKLTSTIKWEITDAGVLKITGTGDMPDFKDREQKKHWRQREDKIKGFPVQTGITAIEIGEGITSIGNFSFEVCYGIPTNGNSRVSVSLPSTLEYIGLNAFRGQHISAIDFPDGLKTIGPGAFFATYIPMDKLVLPESLTDICTTAFNSINIKELVINGNPKVRGTAFEYCPGLRNVLITGNPEFMGDNHILGGPFNGVEDLTIVVPDDYVVTDVLTRWTKGNTKVYTMSEMERKMEAHKSVSSYVAYYLPEWEEYLNQQVEEGKLLSTEDARAAIDTKIKQWQAKGEFETTAAWQKRVTDKTRQKELNRLLAERKKEVDAVKKKYIATRDDLVKKFYDELIDKARAEYKNEIWELQRYDADNETYLVTSKHHGDVLLKVPRAQAKSVKEGWEDVNTWYSSGVEYVFAPKDESSVALTKIVFCPGHRRYVYDGSTDANYAVADINYNFAPLEIENLDYDLADATAPTPATPVKTVGTKGISTKKIEADHRQLSVGSGRASATATSSKVSSDIDRNLPKASAQRPNTFALVIANENYRRVSPVPYALNDGNSMAAYLETTLGLPAKNIIPVADASLNDIQYNLKRLGDICRAFKGEASVIVYYAGHGVPDDSSKDAYLLPVDGYAESVASSGISLNNLIKTIEEMPTQSSILLLDACFSGTGREGAMLSQARGVKLKPKANAVGGNLVMFSASQGDETAHPYDEQGHGMFTYFLLKKIRDSKGKVTLGELSNYVTEQVTRTSVVNGTPQTPTVKAAPSNASWPTRDL